MSINATDLFFSRCQVRQGVDADRWSNANLTASTCGPVSVYLEVPFEPPVNQCSIIPELRHVVPPEDLADQEQGKVIGE